MHLPDTEKLIRFLNNLFNTNNDFVGSHDNKFFEKFYAEQKPHLTILKCSDSRVQMESFDKTPQNGVFAIRNIGNQIQNSEGSVDFGVRVLKTPFLLIIGHSGCGAVEAVLSKAKPPTDAIASELQSMELESSSMEEAIVENINKQVAHAMKKYQDLVSSGALVIMGAVYDFKNDFGFGCGRVVLVSINGTKDGYAIHGKYADSVKHLRFL